MLHFVNNLITKGKVGRVRRVGKVERWKGERGIEGIPFGSVKSGKYKAESGMEDIGYSFWVVSW